MIFAKCFPSMNCRIPYFLLLHVPLISIPALIPATLSSVSLRAKFFNKTISIPLASEQLVFCCGLNSSYNQLVSTKNLDVRNEIFLSWGEDFSRWHTYWFGTSTPPRIELETTSLLEEYLFTNDRWAILPISVAESPPMLKILKICKLSDPPPERTIYAVSRADYNANLHEMLLADMKTVLNGRNGFVLL